MESRFMSYYDKIARINSLELDIPRLEASALEKYRDNPKCFISWVDYLALFEMRNELKRLKEEVER